MVAAASSRPPYMSVGLLTTARELNLRRFAARPWLARPVRLSVSVRTIEFQMGRARLAARRMTLKSTILVRP
jgi:hypothetical protein